jgi:hypothetical protein
VLEIHRGQIGWDLVRALANNARAGCLPRDPPEVVLPELNIEEFLTALTTAGRTVYDNDKLGCLVVVEKPQESSIF